MEQEVIQKYNEAMRISDKVMEFARDVVKKEIKILNIAESIEKMIKESGAGIAFPVNISINENAAHYTPDVDDETELKTGDLVKIDMGLHVDGYICDRAFTVCMGRNNHPLIEASEKALKEALKVIKPGVKICEVSEVVEDTINNFGFNPIHNLCGHGLERYNQHAHPSIPNGKNNIKEELKSGVIAMEVFATNGTGMVKESRPILIYQYMNDVPVRMSDARKILERSKKDFNGLPFTKRWMGDITPVRMDMALKQLVDVGGLREFALLKEETKGLVAQTEETIII